MNSTRAKHHPRRYKYDAALSFAGEDRPHAEALFNELSQRGFSVFYDKNQQACLWGKTPKAFENIYGPQARFVIPFVSKHYVQKDWTLYEFETAKREQQKRRGEFILPVRLDDSRLLGLHDEVIRLDARRTSIEQIAQLFTDKCRRHRSEPRARVGPRTQLIALDLLKHEARRALGLIATAAVPLPRAHFERLFPRYSWGKLVAIFRRAGLMETGGSLLQLTQDALACLNDAAEQKALRQLWIDRLTPLAAHVDTAAYLSFHLLAAGQVEGAAGVATNVVHNTNLGWWNQIYLPLLEVLTRPRNFKRLTRQMQVRVLNSRGTALANARRYQDALASFARMRRLSKASRNAWGIGQSLLNAGVASHNGGDDKSAERLYLQAVKHARRSRDHMLLGRALGNLSQIYQGKDLVRAERLLEESVKAKTAAGDSTGIAGSLIVRGNLAVGRGDFLLAARWYQEASRRAAHLGLRHEQALSKYNHGRALQDLGKVPSAARAYERARELALPDDYTDVLLLSLNALGAATFQMQQFRRAHGAARDLLALARRTKQQEYELGAMHLLAVASRAAMKDSSKSEFRAAIRVCRVRNAEGWLTRCLVDSTRGATSGGVGDPDIPKLRRVAKRIAAEGKYGIVGEIWQVIAQVSARSGDCDEASNAYQMAKENFARNKDSEGAEMDLCRNWFGWAWDARRYDEALKVLSSIENLARKSGRKSDAIAAMDQRGICMQELGKYGQGEVLHRAAAAAAQKIGDNEQQERSLNNRGEALRKLGRNAEAIQAFHDAEAIARKMRRIEAWLSTAHNRALALEAIGRRAESYRLLRRCRDTAARYKCWREYVSAWEGLANLTWAVGKPRAALPLYRRADREAHNRGSSDIRPRIALNLARLLRAERKTKSALRALAPFRESFDAFVDAHEYFGTLAGLYDDAGMPREAAMAWRDAKVRAIGLGDLDYASRCTSHEARSLAKLGKATLSKAALRRSIESENDPIRRADLLIQMLKLLTTKKPSKAPQAVFDEATEFCRKHELHGQIVELHLFAGDHNLAEAKYGTKLKAFKAYTVALMNSFLADPKGMGPTVSHILMKLASPDSPLTEASLKSLVQDLGEHIRAHVRNGNQLATILLWPFRMAEELFPLRKEPRRFLARAQSLTRPEAINRLIKGPAGDGVAA